MCHIWLLTVLHDPRFFSLLLEFDRDLLRQAQEGRCLHCGEVVHRGDFERKPRGAPGALPEGFSTRFSLCCSRCRRRLTPPSVRFLGRKVYLGVVVVLATALMHGPSPPRVARLQQALGVSRRTLKRWRLWWRESYGKSRCFRSLRALLRAPIDATLLPLSLLDAVGARSLWEAMLLVLRLLRPISSATAGSKQAL